jgi:dihydroorotate dehydrogenase
MKGCSMYSLLRALLFQIEPEKSHHLSLNALSVLQRMHLIGLLSAKVADNPRQVMGLNFKNPVGLAAGLDKNGDYIDALSQLGFGFIEIGTVTPRPQIGNPQPRLFRLPEHEAIINRMGFNNHGVDYLVERVQQSKYQGVLGINIGKNKDTPNENAVDDYVHCMNKVYAHASYITVNLSSPNTPGLRDLQFGEPLKRLLEQLKTTQHALQVQHQKRVPLVIKVAPDMTSADIQDVAESLLHFEIDGLIATNTTISRDLIKDHPLAAEAGGLSGAPVAKMSTQTIKQFTAILGDKVPVIGVGGITDANSAKDKVLAGAELVQIYSGFIYHGADLIKQAASAFE